MNHMRSAYGDARRLRRARIDRFHVLVEWLLGVATAITYAALVAALNLIGA